MLTSIDLFLISMDTLTRIKFCKKLLSCSCIDIGNPIQSFTYEIVRTAQLMKDKCAKYWSYRFESIPCIIESMANNEVSSMLKDSLKHDIDHIKEYDIDEFFNDPIDKNKLIFLMESIANDSIKLKIHGKNILKNLLKFEHMKNQLMIQVDVSMFNRVKDPYEYTIDSLMNVIDTFVNAVNSNMSIVNDKLIISNRIPAYGVFAATTNQFKRVTKDEIIDEIRKKDGIAYQ